MIEKSTTTDTTTMVLLLRRSGLTCIVALAITYCFEVVASKESQTTASSATTSPSESWHDCYIFLAPSSSGGYGVFAARDFKEDEVVELAPFFSADEHDAPYIMNTALQDYIYTYLRFLPEPSSPLQKLMSTIWWGLSFIYSGGDTQRSQPPEKSMSSIVWGLGMMYNHHSQAPNIRWTSFGFEPTPHHPYDVRATGFIATRFIQTGEELLSSYGQDGGATWFKGRGLTMVTTPPESNRIPSDQLSDYQHQYCSKIFAGLDDALFAKRMKHWIGLPNFYAGSRLAPSTITTRNDTRAYEDPNYPHAIAKVPILKGNRIELAVALVLDRNKVVDTPLAPLVYYYHELTPELQASVRSLRDEGYYVVQYQGLDSNWRREDHFTTFEDLVILPVGGWIGRVERVNGSAANAAINCEFRILPSDFQTRNSTLSQQQWQRQRAKKKQNPFSLGSAGIVLELLATRDIAQGERLQMNLPSTVTFRERLMLYNEMERSGQLYTLSDHPHEPQQQPEPLMATTEPAEL